MDDIIERPLKELFAAVFHSHQKDNSSNEIRHDQEKVLNELLKQPVDFKNKVFLKKDGLEVYTQREDMLYIHSDNLDSRVIKRSPRNRQ
ncbi:MAG TPA: hypothetical protein VJ184_08515 [Chryseolinea sp.]|nr:hypothetical protein [Chryseolinea sp.]